MFETIIEFSLLLIIPISVGVNYLGYRIIEFIYDFGSYEAATAFSILIVAEIFVFLTTIMGNFISSADKQKAFMKIAGIGALINIILNFALIPEFSLYGAGFATLITYLIMFIIMLIYINKSLLHFRFFNHLIIPAIASFLMWLVLINILHLHLILIIIISALVYSIPVVIYFLTKRKTLSTLKELLTK